jgi:LysM repeat protein
MPPEQPLENVARRLENTRQGQDFSSVTEELQRIQRENPRAFSQNLRNLNERVDMRALGFPDNLDFEITGLGQGGRVLTRNPDGRRIERDGRTFEPVSEQAPREFRPQPDGTGRYTVRQGDTLWDISRERMAAQLGRTPTPQEITGDYRNLARLNGIQDPNRIRPGQEIRVPRPGERPPEARPAAAPAEQVQPLRQADLQRQAQELPRNVSHPLIVPGLNSEPGLARQETIRRTGSGRDNTTSGLPEERINPSSVRQTQLPDGSTRQQYEVTVGGNGFPPSNVERVLDRQGNVIRSQVTYPEQVNPIRVQVPASAGGRNDVYIEAPRTATTTRGQDGNYTTEIVEQNGRRHTFRTDGRSGRLTHYEAR